jgi:hypothetical protein
MRMQPQDLDAIVNELSNAARATDQFTEPRERALTAIKGIGKAFTMPHTKHQANCGECADSFYQARLEFYHNGAKIQIHSGDMGLFDAHDAYSAGLRIDIIKDGRDWFFYSQAAETCFELFDNYTNTPKQEIFRTLAELPEKIRYSLQSKAA